MKVDLRRLLEKLGPECQRALEAASGVCVTRGHYEVGIEHLLHCLLEDEQLDPAQILIGLDIPVEGLRRQLQASLESLRSGNQGRPVFSPLLVEWLESAWLTGSVDLGGERLRSGALLAVLAADPYRFLARPLAEWIARLDSQRILADFASLTAQSKEGTPAGPSGSPPAAGPGDSRGALGRFAIDFTALAREDRIDPVFARDDEIRQIIDILGRRRKNNPIAVGEAGVGKTAVVEGLARRIAAGDVPDFLQGVTLMGLDLGQLQAGAGVKGEFEARLKGVIDEVKASPTPIILFIDEAHTLIGAGGPQGGGDAANLLKPALARGELRTIAATTWSEYRKYFEKDPALARRFQLVRLAEPTIAQAVTILRGARESYEASHGVRIQDEALRLAASLSARYLTGRQLPDKAVDVLDTACARVRIQLTAQPVELDQRARDILELEREQASLVRDMPVDPGQRADDQDRLAAIERELRRIREEIPVLEARFAQEKSLVGQITDASEAGQAPETVLGLKQQLRELQGESGMLSPEVDGAAIARVIADWTGVPAGAMLRDEALSMTSLGERLRARIKGQDAAIDCIERTLRAARVGLTDPGTPPGVFLLVGPSGTGKTETATALAAEMFGSPRCMTTINMSEFQEKHAVSRLIGSPPGYVGYGEGGVLTEAVRQRPYGALLLDEVEKADLEVMNLFYQVFDKGELSDSEGREINFRNTVIFLTSNLATDLITRLGLPDGEDGAEPPDIEELREQIRPVLARHFKPALLARMQIVPYFPLGNAVLADIARLKLERLQQRLLESQRLHLHYGPELAEGLAARCTEVDSGARNVDHILSRTIIPQLSNGLLARMAEGTPTSSVHLSLDADGIRCEFQDADGLEAAA